MATTQLRYEARNVVVASGMLRVPKIPAIARSLPAGIAQLHSGTYRRPADLPSGAVLIVGSGQSGVQIAEDLLDSGRTVYLSTSAVARLRRRYRGRDALEWLVDAGRFYGVPVPRLPDPQVRFQTLWTTSGVGRFGHTVSLQSLADRGAILLGRPIGIDGDRLSLDDSVGANIAFGDRRSAEFNAELATIVESAGLEPPPLEPDPADVPHPDPLSVRSPTELDLGVAGVSTVIWATGLRRRPELPRRVRARRARRADPRARGRDGSGHLLRRLPVAVDAQVRDHPGCRRGRGIHRGPRRGSARHREGTQ